MRLMYKIEYREYEKSFLDEIKSSFFNTLRVILRWLTKMAST